MRGHNSIAFQVKSDVSWCQSMKGDTQMFSKTAIVKKPQNYSKFLTQPIFCLTDFYWPKGNRDEFVNSFNFRKFFLVILLSYFE